MTAYSVLALMVGSLLTGALLLWVYLQDEPVSQRARRAPDAGSRGRHPSNSGRPTPTPRPGGAAGQLRRQRRQVAAVCSLLVLGLTVVSAVAPTVGTALRWWAAVSWGLAAAWMALCLTVRWHARRRAVAWTVHVTTALDAAAPTRWGTGPIPLEDTPEWSTS